MTAASGAATPAAAAMPPAMPVTWQDILAAADRHPGLAAGRSRVDAARGGVGAAGAIPNLQLEGSAGEGEAREGGATRSEWGLSLTLPLEWLAQRGPRVAAARAGVDLALAEVQALRRDAILQLETLFWTLAYEQARVAALQALQEQTAELVRTVQRRVQEGEARPVEAPRVEIELEKVAAELDAARIALDARQAELGLWLAVPAGTPLEAVADLAGLPAAMSREEALAAARANHPQPALWSARLRALEAEAESERRARIPGLSLTGFKIDELDRTAYGAGLAVDLPLWNRNAGGIAQAEARLAAGRHQAEASRLELEAAVIAAQAAAEASLAAAARLKDRVVPRSEAAAATMEKAYRLGEADLLEVIDSRRTLLEARRQYLSALVQAQIDHSRLGALVSEVAP